MTTDANPSAAALAETAATYALVAFDLYRDIHKAIRNELFAVTTAAGNIDPNDRMDRAALADHIASVIELTESHADHEDSHIDAVLQAHAPELADKITADHHAFEPHLRWIGDFARQAAEATAGDFRRDTHLIYLELSAFTSAYLAHQLVEEREVMPALEKAVGIDTVLGLHHAIVSSIPPPEMAQALAIMFPAMNVDDRVEMLAGMKAAAPPEVFDGTLGIARSVLEPAQFTALAGRLGLIG